MATSPPDPCSWLCWHSDGVLLRVCAASGRLVACPDVLFVEVHHLSLLEALERKEIRIRHRRKNNRDWKENLKSIWDIIFSEAPVDKTIAVDPSDVTNFHGGQFPTFCLHLTRKLPPETYLRCRDNLKQSLGIKWRSLLVKYRKWPPERWGSGVRASLHKNNSNLPKSD